MRFCTNCGAKIVPGDKFCRECGAELVREVPEAGWDSPAPKPDPVRMEVERIAYEQNPPTFMGVRMDQFMGMMGSGPDGGRHISYSTHGMAFNSGFDYSIYEKERKLYARMRIPNPFKQDYREFEIPDEIFDHITELIDRNNGDSWDGFNGHNDGVMDGESFSFSYNDGKGRRISCSGYMSWPDGFGVVAATIKCELEAAYAIRFPDYTKDFEEFFEEDVIGKYGESNRGVTAGNDVSFVPYVHSKPGYLTIGENTLPAGLLGYRILKEYCDMDSAGEISVYRGISVLVDKVPVDYYPLNETGIKIQYYGMEEPGEFKLYDEIKVVDEVVKSHMGSFSVFTYHASYGPVLGFWEDMSWNAGDVHQIYMFKLYRINKDKLELIDEVELKVTGEEKELSDENLEKLCGVAEKAGIDHWATKFRNTAYRKYISMPTQINAIANFSWLAHFCEGFEELNETLSKGQQIGDSGIRVRGF